MIRKRTIFCIGIALAVLAWRPAAAAGAQESAFSIKDVPSFAYCCIVHKGPLTDMTSVIGQLMQEMQGQNLFPTIQGPMIGVYYNSPGEVQPGELSWEVGFIVTPQATSLAPLYKKVWEYPTVAATVHVGPYAEVGETIGRLLDRIKEQGYTVTGPVLERYLNNPMQVKPEELQTEIWIPVEKK
jgi:effector-binding domain-containing protein